MQWVGSPPYITGQCVTLGQDQAGIDMVTMGTGPAWDWHGNPGEWLLYWWLTLKPFSRIPIVLTTMTCHGLQWRHGDVIYWSGYQRNVSVLHYISRSTYCFKWHCHKYDSLDDTVTLKIMISILWEMQGQNTSLRWMVQVTLPSVQYIKYLFTCSSFLFPYGHVLCFRENWSLVVTSIPGSLWKESF